MANSLWQSHLTVVPPSGVDGVRKANDSRLSPSVGACTELEQAQLRQQLLLQHKAIIKEKILLKASRSTHDFHNFLGINGAKNGKPTGA